MAKVISIVKNIIDQSGARGKRDIASGYTINAKP